MCRCPYFRTSQSFPSRERGLKFLFKSFIIKSRCRSLRGNVDWNFSFLSHLFSFQSSFPSRERGLKSILDVAPCPWFLCRSLRGNVDWNCIAVSVYPPNTVVPFAGTWIEIILRFSQLEYHHVVPFAGTWIEIFLSLVVHTQTYSRSLRGNVDWNLLQVYCYLQKYSSFPSRERGLKFLRFSSFLSKLCRSLRGNVDWNNHFNHLLHYDLCRSLRGNVDWNTQAVVFITALFVVPFAGTWIEILLAIDAMQNKIGRSLRGNVDWNERSKNCNSTTTCRSLRGNVDWNQKYRILHKVLLCRSLRGNVDWNQLIQTENILKKSSFPSRERGLKFISSK